MNTIAETKDKRQVASTDGVNQAACQIKSTPQSANGSGGKRRPGAREKEETSAQFLVRKIARLKKFVEKLKNPDVDPRCRRLSLHLASQLSAGSSALVSKWPEVSPAEVHDAFVADLNRFIQTASQEEWFGELTLAPETLELVKQRPSGPDLQKLRRMVLHDAYPGEISKCLQRSYRETSRVGPKGSGLFRIAGVWGIFAKVKIAGRTRTKAMETDDSATARTSRAEWVAGLLKNQGLVGVAKDALASFLPGYFKSRQELITLGKISQDTVDDEILKIRHVAAHWARFNTIQLEQFDPNAIKELQDTLLTKARDRRYKDTSHGKGLTKSTYNTYMAPIYHLVKYLFEQKKLTAEQYLALKNVIKWATKSSRKVEIPTSEQFTKMRAYLYKIRAGRSRGQCGVKADFLFLCGSRLQTVNAAQVKHINFARRRIKLTKLKHREGQPDEKEVPMLEELAIILERWIKARKLGPDDFLFSGANINGALKAAAKHAGLANWYHHACRKWFATMCLEQTGDPLAIAELLCHNDGGEALLFAYRQACAAHLEPKVRSLKLLPGAVADATLSAACAKAQRALAKIQNLDKTHAALILDHILWIETQVDDGDYEALSALPGHRLPTLPIYVPPSQRIVIEPNYQLLKKNLHHLVAQRGIVCTDIAIATGIKLTKIESAYCTGKLQAVVLPKLCGYFNVTPMDLLTVDLEDASTFDAAAQNGSTVPDAAGSEPTKAAEDANQAADPNAESDAPREKSADDLVLEQNPIALAQTVSRNLLSLLYERDLTVPELATKSGVSKTVIYRYVGGACIPFDSTLAKLSMALGVRDADIFNPERDSIIPDPTKIKANLRAIRNHHGMSDNEYFSSLKVGKICFKLTLLTGEISPHQAKKVAAYEQISVRELLSEDVTAKFPCAPAIDAAVVARNLNSLFFERGIVRQHLRTKCRVNEKALVRYLRGEVDRPNREVLAKIADGLQVSVDQLADPTRPEIKLTGFFAANLRHLFGQTRFKPFTICRGFAVAGTGIDDLCSGASSPTPTQVAGLGRLFGVSPGELLMHDLTSRVLIRDSDSKGVCRWRLDGHAK